MNTLYLRTFIEVVNLKNISKAAEKLYITQPAVTKQLKILEGEFGTVLLKRDGRDITPTLAGKDLYKYAVNTLNAENNIIEKLKHNAKIMGGELNIYSSSMPADYYLSEILLNFDNQYENVTYNINKIDTKQVFSNIDSGTTNFGFVGTILKKKNLKYINIAEDELVIAGSAKSYNEYKDKEVDIDFLLDKNLILREEGSATLSIFKNYLDDKNINLRDMNVKIRVENNETIKEFVKNEMGVSVISKVAIKKDIEDGTIVPIYIKDSNLKRKLYYVYNTSRYFSRIEEAFKTYILDMYFQ